MADQVRRLSRKKFDSLDNHKVSRVQHSVYKKLFRDSANKLIWKICDLDSVVAVSKGKKEYKFARGKKDYDGGYTSRVSQGLIKYGQIDKMYQYFGLCYWIVLAPNAPEGFHKRQLKCSTNFLKRNNKRLKIRNRYFELAEKYPKKFESKNFVNQALTLLASCCVQKQLTDIEVKIKTKKLNKLIKQSKSVFDQNRKINLA